MQEKEKTTLGILGVRDVQGKRYTNKKFVAEQLNLLIARYNLPKSSLDIVTGGSLGSESLAIEWATSNSVPYRRIPPNIEGLGPRKAFAARNEAVVAACDMLLLFWDGYLDTLFDAAKVASLLKKTTIIIPAQ